MNGPASSFALPVGIGGSEALPPKRGENAGIHTRAGGTRNPASPSSRTCLLTVPGDSAWAFLICNNPFEGLPTLRWDEMTDYPEVLSALESFWAAADSGPLKAFGGLNPRFLPTSPHSWDAFLWAFARSSDSRLWGQWTLYIIKPWQLGELNFFFSPRKAEKQDVLCGPPVTE